MNTLKVTDIMVSDIIRYADQEKPQKATIDTLHAIKEGAKVVGVDFTEEILKKMDFERHTFNGTIIYSKKSFVDIYWYDVDVEIGKDAEGIQRWDCVCIKIRKAGANLTLYNQSCFHQLQHALRLVGLNDVADNLKA